MTNLPATRDDKPKLPSTEAGAIEAASGVAEAMLENESDADPLAIKGRAQAAMHLCDEQNWPEAKREFAYAAICCEFRWTRENPRTGQGARTDKTPKETSATVAEVSETTARRLHETYDAATEDDLREAKTRADETGEAVTRRHVRDTVEPPPDPAEGQSDGTEAASSPSTDTGPPKPKRSKMVTDWCRAAEKVREIDFPTVLSAAKSDEEAALCRAAFEDLAAWLDDAREQMKRGASSRPAAKPMPLATGAVTAGTRTVGDDARKGWPGKGTKTGATWHAYAEAYHSRYGAYPVWNATMGGKLGQFVNRVGQIEAPDVAAFYVRHDDAWYRKQGHAIGIMLQNAEKLRTEWKTNRRISADTRSDPMDAARIARDRREARERGER